MALLPRYDSPAFMNDFETMPGMREAWHRFVSLTFDSVVASEQPFVFDKAGKPGTVQYYNAATYDPGGAVVNQAITWNAFPKELLRRFGRARAMVEADRLWPLAAYPIMASEVFEYDPAVPDANPLPTGISRDMLFRPLVEYCEWHVDRDPLDGRIQKITFCSEPPEYWQAMFGDPITVGSTTVNFPGDPKRVLELYRELISPDVQLEDLVVPKSFTGGQGEPYQVGQYNPYNVWNTRRGIAHLSAPPNSLGAEIQLGGDATVLYKTASGDPVVHPDALICCAGFGGPNRNSDPTIGASVNALARAQAMITLVNPVGLYMDHIDTNGWSFPGGLDPKECLKIVRGTPGMIERLVVQTPEKSGVVLDDLTIGGEPLRYGGQIAECITVKLVGSACQLGTVANAPIKGRSYCLIDKANATELVYPQGKSVPPGYQLAFVGEGGETEGSSVSQATSVVVRPSAKSRRPRFL